jgi:hypothetical protein
MAQKFSKGLTQSGRLPKTATQTGRSPISKVAKLHVVHPA